MRFSGMSSLVLFQYGRLISVEFLPFLLSQIRYHYGRGFFLLKKPIGCSE